MTINQKRIISFWLSILIAYVTPILIISFKYDLFKTYISAGTKVTTWLLLMILFLLIKLWGEFHKFVEDMNEGWLRETILVLMGIGPYLMLLGAALLVDYFANDFVFVAKVVSLSFLGAVPFTVYHNYHNRKRKIARGDIRVLK